MPFLGTIGSQGLARSLVGTPQWVTAAGSLGTLNDNQRANTITVSGVPGGGATSVTYSLLTGSLPTGASLNSSTGVISGFSPTSSNTTSNFTLRLLNNAGLFVDRAFSITINAAAVTWSTAAGALPGASQNTAYSTTIVATATSGTISYSVVSGSLPGSVSLNASTGVISGTPSNNGSFSFTIRATTTSASVSADRAFSIAVAAPIIDLIDSTVFQNLRNYLTSQQGRYQNSSFYAWSLDSGPGQIGDGGGDMYDGGHCIVLRESGSQVAGGCLDFNTSNTTASNLRWGAGGYTYPLMAMATSGRANRRYGWSSSGNLGADGGGSTTGQTVYNTQTVNGCLVHSWISNKSYNAGDPSVNYLYVTIGHSNLGSSINSIDVLSNSGSPDDDSNQYETTSFNCLNWRVLCSKSGGSIVNVGDAQSIISNLTTDFRAHFGF